MTTAMYLMLILLWSIVSAHLLVLDVQNFMDLSIHFRFPFVFFVLPFGFIFALMTIYVIGRPRKVYLVDFACYKPEPAQKCSREIFMRQSANSGQFSEQSLLFQKKILEKSGYGEMTYAPKGLLQVPTIISLAESRHETQTVVFGSIDELLAKTKVKLQNIRILVVNSSMFNPTPSLSAMIVNHYRLRDDILSYNLGGMGCSAGLISIDIAKDLLQVHRNSYALVVSTENITQNWYFGNDRSMLVTNCLFRVGGAAILLSNRSCDRRHSKYQLIHTLRVNKGADDKCYNCIMQQEDQTQRVGVSLSKDLVAVAGEALKANITALGPLVLPLSEKLLYLLNFIARRVFKIKAETYVPNFKLAFEHFCLHAGGRGVLDELEKNLKLTEWHMEPSRMTLNRFGNTSSSSLWYELAYSEAKGRIKKGHMIWQIGFGSGFKCNSAVWRAMQTINPAKENNPWADEIDDFPVYVPKLDPIVY